LIRDFSEAHDSLFKIEIYPDANSLQDAAAERIAVNLENGLREKECVRFVLSGGNTPKPVYRRLAASGIRNRLDWNRIHFFWGDERCVPPDDPKSNFRMAWDAFLSAIQTPPSNIHRILGEMKDANKAAQEYQREILRIQSGQAIPVFDLVLLGLGEDGHTASLFPGMLWDEDRLVISQYVEKLGIFRISMTSRLFNAARTVIFLVSGCGKSNALASVLTDTSSRSPAALIRPKNGSLIWMVDRQAASNLPPGFQPPFSRGFVARQ
jgi:6-phosphogluconolactonase